MENTVLIFSICLIASSLLPITAYASNDNGDNNTIISIYFIGPDTIDLQKDNRLIRLNVDIENFDPQNGYYFMKVSNGTNEFFKSEIFPYYKTGGLWTVQIAHMVDDTLKNIVGNHTITVYTEFGPASNKATFSVINPIQNNQTAENEKLQENANSKQENKDVKSKEKFRITYKKTTIDDDEDSRQKEIQTVNRPEPSYAFYGPLEHIKMMVFWQW